MIFINTNERLKSSFPKQYLIMIALEDVHRKNDLIMNARTVSLISEQDLILNDDDEMYFSKNDEGMTLFLVLDLMSEVIV